MKPAVSHPDISPVHEHADIATHGIKKRIAKRFGDAARAYDKGAQVQKSIADYLLQWSSLFLIEEIESAKHSVEEYNEAEGVCLDIGCGTGYLGKQVSHRFHQWLNVDLAKGMLRAAREQAKAVTTQHKAFIVGDAEHLPLADNTLNTVLSSMALQWCSSPQVVIDELHRVLMHNGTAVLAIMVSPSFHSLSQAWQSQNMPSRINTFATADDWLDAVNSLQWQVRTHRACFHSEHESVSAMLKSIKTVGASERVDQKQQSTFSKTELQSLSTYFQGQSRHTLEYEVLFIECKKEDLTP
jgi:malonyl-CoA O-methyltransferase